MRVGGEGEREREGDGGRGTEDRLSHGALPLLASCLILTLLVPVLLLSRPATRPSPDLRDYPWLYLRDGDPLRSDEAVAEVVAVGDVMLGRGVGAEPGVFGSVAPWLRGADVTLGNLECVIVGGAAGASPPTSSKVASEAELTLHAPPRAARQLRGAGFDVLGLANNHALDRGSAGLSETASRLQAAGVAVVGAGEDADAAVGPLIREVRGVRLGFLAFNAVPDGRAVQDGGWTPADWDPERAVAAVEAASQRVDGVVVSVHWGYEYETRVDPAQRAAAAQLLEAGADLVVGHHPHVVQGFEAKDGRCVAYSLGNVVFDQGRGGTGQGLALRAFFDRQGLRAVQALPVWAGLHPRLMAPEEAEGLLARVEPPPQRVRFACDEAGCRRLATADDGREAREGRRSSLFWGGRIDLTGDGVAEHVRRVDEQVIVTSGGAEVWRSPTAWRVVDVALGDPNDDGRAEMVLALWKRGLDGLETPSPEKERVPRSHPFIVGYRGGIYRTLWGGSAVSDPIHEIELGDIDGDGMEELVVVDGDDPDRRTVSVWRWHGWGYSLAWRSGPGAYRGLTLGEDGIIQVAVE